MEASLEAFSATMKASTVFVEACIRFHGGGGSCGGSVNASVQVVEYSNDAGDRVGCAYLFLLLLVRLIPTF